MPCSPISYARRGEAFGLRISSAERALSETESPDHECGRADRLQ
jgi:hypothetical protein